jgi:group I intron endonuclease
MNNKIIPLVTYTNLDKYKHIIISENKRKPGIYRFNNLITGKCYVGSSVDLSNRFRSYYSVSNMKRIVNNEKSIIYESILKNGYENFSLDILEFCDVNVLIKREQYYIDLLEPEYNILKIAGSRLGHKLSEKTKKNLSISNRGRTVSYETRQNISRANILPKTRLNMSLRSYGVSVKVFDKSNNFVKEFPTLGSAAKYLNISLTTIRSIERRGISYDNYIYKFEAKDTRI